jgi:hypothetical protein
MCAVNVFVTLCYFEENRSKPSFLVRKTKSGALHTLSKITELNLNKKLRNVK